MLLFSGVARLVFLPRLAVFLYNILILCYSFEKHILHSIIIHCRPCLHAAGKKSYGLFNW